MKQDNQSLAGEVLVLASTFLYPLLLQGSLALRLECYQRLACAQSLVASTLKLGVHRLALLLVSPVRLFYRWHLVSSLAT